METEVVPVEAPIAPQALARLRYRLLRCLDEWAHDEYDRLQLPRLLTSSVGPHGEALKIEFGHPRGTGSMPYEIVVQPSRDS